MRLFVCSPSIDFEVIKVSDQTFRMLRGQLPDLQGVPVIYRGDEESWEHWPALAPEMKMTVKWK